MAETIPPAGSGLKHDRQSGITLPEWMRRALFYAFHQGEYNHSKPPKDAVQRNAPQRN
jgi:hypothetical protein